MNKETTELAPAASDLEYQSPIAENTIRLRFTNNRRLIHVAQIANQAGVEIFEGDFNEDNNCYSNPFLLFSLERQGDRLARALAGLELKDLRLIFGFYAGRPAVEVAGLRLGKTEQSHRGRPSYNIGIFRQLADALRVPDPKADATLFQVASGIIRDVDPELGNPLEIRFFYDSEGELACHFSTTWRELLELVELAEPNPFKQIESPLGKGSVFSFEPEQIGALRQTTWLAEGRPQYSPRR